MCNQTPRPVGANSVTTDKPDGNGVTLSNGEHTFDFYRIHPFDNVAVALHDTESQGVFIPSGHKIAVHDIHSGHPVIKYGFPIGLATKDIPCGTHVHTHNLRSSLNDERTDEKNHNIEDTPPQSAAACGDDTPVRSFFMGYQRADGRVGIRNEIWIINTVGCINGVAEAIATEANRRFAGETDGVFAFSHPFGCSQTGADHVNTQKILSALIRHPNAGGVLVLGLGCENNHIHGLRAMLGETDPERVRFMQLQDTGDEQETALGHIASLVALTRGDRRTSVPMEELTIGLKCGGSDGLSGITANPLLGRVSDRVLAAGGTVLLTEVPEMFGAEAMLYGRCTSPALRKNVVALIENFKQYYIDHGEPVDENPSPGNRAGGITTLAEKSLGCTQKGGTGMIAGVVPYGGKPAIRGLHLLESPGNDMVSSTALAAAGAQLVLFTTGRGTPFGAPVPTVKVSSNTALYHNKPHWIDFDAGSLADGADMDSLADALFDLLQDIASGKRQTLNEQNACRSIAVWKNGVTL